MNRQSGSPLRLFVDPFAVWRQLALKTGEMLVASACAGAARASAVRVAVIDEREPVRRVAAVREASRPKPARAKASGARKHKKRARRR